MAITDSLRKRAKGITTEETTEPLVEVESELASPEQLLEEEVFTYAGLTFWYGISPTEIVTMPMNILRGYIRALPVLLAQYQNMLIIGGAYAYMPEKDQKSIQAGLQAASERKQTADNGKIDLKDLGPRARQMLFKQLGISFEEAPTSIDAEELRGMGIDGVPDA